MENNVFRRRISRRFQISSQILKILKRKKVMHINIFANLAKKLQKINNFDYKVNSARRYSTSKVPTSRIMFPDAELRVDSKFEVRF